MTSSATESYRSALTSAQQQQAAVLHKVLLEGGVFLKHRKSGPSKYKFIMCSPASRGKDMLLYWVDLPSDPQKKPSPPTDAVGRHCIRLTDVTMLLKGKNSKTFQRKACESAPEQLCFTIVTKKRTLDLQAASNNQRDLWVQAIAHMVTDLHSKRVAKHKRKAKQPSSNGKSGSSSGSSRINSTPKATDSVSESSVSMTRSALDAPEQTEEAKMIAFLQQGGTLIKHGRSGKPKPKFVYASKGRLYWCSPDKVGGSNHPSVVFSQVKGVLPGKNTEVFGRRHAKEVPSVLCFSLITRERTLDLQATSREARDYWLKAIRFANHSAKEKEDLMRRILSPGSGGSSSSLGNRESSTDSVSLTSISRNSSMDVESSPSSSLTDDTIGRTPRVATNGKSAASSSSGLTVDATAARVAAVDADDDARREDDSPPPPPPPPPEPEMTQEEREEEEKWLAMSDAKAQKRQEKQAQQVARQKAKAEAKRQKEAQKQKAQEEKERRKAEEESERLRQDQTNKQAEAQAQAEALAEYQKKAQEQARMLEEAQRKVRLLEEELQRAKTKEQEEREREERERHRAKRAAQKEKADAEAKAKAKAEEEAAAVAAAAAAAAKAAEDALKAVSDNVADEKKEDASGDNKKAEEEEEKSGPVSVLKKRVSDDGTTHHIDLRSVNVGASDKKLPEGSPSSTLRKGVTWRENLVDIKEVEKIIILADSDSEYDDDELDDPAAERDTFDDDDDATDVTQDEEDSSVESAVEQDDTEVSENGGDDSSVSEMDDDAKSKDKALKPIADVTSFMQKYRDLTSKLVDLKTDWTARVAAMNQLEEHIQDKALHRYIPNWWAEMDTLKQCIAAQLEDLRSSIVREACNLLITLTECLGHLEEFAAVIKFLLPTLFKRLPVTIKVIANASDECIRAVLTRSYFWSFKCIPEILDAAQTDAHPVVRARCVEYLTQILNECADDQFSSVFVYERPLASLLKHNINDQDKIVRAASRQLFLAFANVWPQLAHKLYDKFSKQTQRTITAELKKIMY